MGGCKNFFKFKLASKNRYQCLNRSTRSYFVQQINESNLFLYSKNYKNISRCFKTAAICFEDYYSKLGVTSKATQEDIKKAYFKKVKQYHPDVNKSPDATEKFREVQEAYECIGKQSERLKYDQAGKSSSAYKEQQQWQQAAKSARAGQRSGTSGTRRQTVFHETPIFDDDFFNQFFSSYTSQQKFQVQVPLTISFPESILGCTKQLKLDILKTCETCQGKGIKPGSSLYSCPSCKGSGSVTQRYGPMTYTTQCNSCQGMGKINKDPCRKCNGSGNTHASTSVNVPIPAGTENGTSLHLGDHLNDIFIAIKVEKSNIFRREGYDIHSDINVDFIKAIFGGDVEGETVHGKCYVKIPRGTSSHYRIRVPGKGVSLRGNKGDHIFTVCISVPKQLNEEASKLLKQLDNIIDKKEKATGSDTSTATKSTSNSSSEETNNYSSRFTEFFLIPDAPDAIKLMVYGTYIFILVMILKTIIYKLI